jgi:hypothetical protein
MSCDRHLAAITEHAFGADLAPGTSAHLSACASCRARFDEQRRLVTQVDDDLRRALAIVPSSDFSRQVQARVERQPDRLRGPAAWWLGVAAAAAIVIAMVFMLRPEPARHDVHLQSDGRTISVPDGHGTRAPAAGRVPTDHQRDVTPPRRLPPATSTVRIARPPAGSPAPEVLVPPDQARAIARLIELVNEGALEDVGQVDRMSSSNVFADLAPAPIVVAPITIPDVIIENRRPVSGTER